MEREIWEIVKALDSKKITAIEAHKKLCDLCIVIKSVTKKGQKAKLRERYFIETGIYPLDNISRYSHWLEDEIINNNQIKSNE